MRNVPEKEITLFIISIVVLDVITTVGFFIIALYK